jgi:general secretion pathway protein J
MITASFRPARSHAGFTLLEVLIAVAIFAIVSTMALGGYNELIRQSERINANMTRMRAVQTAVHRMVQDFAELEPRPVREPLGSAPLPVLRAEERSTLLAEMTRAGWSNPAGVPRPTLQRVAYRFEDNKLQRDYWLALDRTLAATPVTVMLLDQVSSVSLRFLSADRVWSDQWPANSGSGSAASPYLRPIAVEITLELEDMGILKRLVEIPG